MKSRNRSILSVILVVFVLTSTSYGQEMLKPVKYRDIDWSDFGQAENWGRVSEENGGDAALPWEYTKTEGSSEQQGGSDESGRNQSESSIANAFKSYHAAPSRSSSFTETTSGLILDHSTTPSTLDTARGTPSSPRYGTDNSFRDSTARESSRGSRMAETMEPTPLDLDRPTHDGLNPQTSDSLPRAGHPQVLRRIITYEMPNLFASPTEGQEGSTYYKMRFPNEQSVMENAFIQVALSPREEVLQIDFRIHKVDGRLVDVPARYLERYEQTWRDSAGRFKGYRWAIPLVQPGDTVEFAYRIRGVQMPAMVSFGHPDWHIEHSEFRLIYLTKFDVVWSARGSQIRQRKFEEFYKFHVYFACDQVPAGALGYAHSHVELGEVPRWITGVWPRSWSSFYYQVDAFQNEYNKRYYKVYERHWQRWWREMGVRDNASRLLAFHHYFSDSIRSAPLISAFNPDAVIAFRRVSDFDAWVLYDEMIRRLGFDANFVLARLPERGLMDSAMLSVQQFDVAFFEVMDEAGDSFILTPPQKGVAYPGTELPRRLRGASGVVIPCHQPESIRMKIY